MSQFSWVLLDDFGQRFNVGLYHGDETGHLMVYCNTKVVLIDFNVLNPKNYSFFLGHELCELTLEKEGEGFSYGLKQNDSISTPLNQLRKKHRKKDQNRTLIAAAVIAITICITFIAFSILA